MGEARNHRIVVAKPGGPQVLEVVVEDVPEPGRCGGHGLDPSERRDGEDRDIDAGLILSPSFDEAIAGVHSQISSSSSPARVLRPHGPSFR